MWGFLIGVALVIPITGVIAWIAFLIFMDSRGTQLTLPRTYRAKVEKKKLAIEEAEYDFILEQKRQLVNDLQNAAYRRAIEGGDK